MLSRKFINHIIQPGPGFSVRHPAAREVLGLLRQATGQSEPSEKFRVLPAVPSSGRAAVSPPCRNFLKAVFTQLALSVLSNSSDIS